MPGDSNYSAFSALRRFAREESVRRETAEDEAAERCDLCGAFIPPDPEHRHLMEVATREILCVCRPCSILFDKEAASEGRYRLVPDRVLNLENFGMTDVQWEGLRVPVDMAGCRSVAGQPGAWGERTFSGPHRRVLQAGRPDPYSLAGLQRWPRGLGRHFRVLRGAETEIQDRAGRLDLYG